MAYGPSEDAMMDFFQQLPGGDSPKGAEIMISWGRDAGEIHWVYSHCTLGRSHDCNIILDDAGVSRRHAEIRWTTQGYVLTDLDSTGGTYVNDAKITAHVLRDGDRIRLGQALLAFTLGHVTLVDRHIHTHSHGPVAEAMAKHAETNLGAPLSLVLFDLDHLKRINDFESLLAGDAVLAHVQSIARAAVRPEDTFVRIGGEEFAVVLPGMLLEAAVEFAEKLRTAVEQSSCRFEGRTIPITISCGVAQWTEPFNKPWALLRVADDRLYDAKKQGRNRVRA